MSIELLTAAVNQLTREQCLAVLASDDCNETALKRATVSALVETKTGVAPQQPRPEGPTITSTPTSINITSPQRPPAPPKPVATPAAAATPAAPSGPKTTKDQADQAVIALYNLSKEKSAGFAKADVIKAAAQMGFGECSPAVAGSALKRGMKAGWLFNGGQRRFSRYGASQAIADAAAVAAKGG